MKTARLIILLLLAGLATSVQAETINCTPITSLPATIDTQGVYCLTGNLATGMTDGSAITITANNVTLDLNGWKVGGQAAGTGTDATGIYSTAVNVTIKNGIVRGFEAGIILEGRGAVVRDMLIDQNTATGIGVVGEGALIEHNQVVDTGGATNGTDVVAYGIEVFGEGSTVSNNVVSGVAATGAATEWGIYAVGTNSTVRDNVVSDTAIPTGGGISTGIYQQQSIAVNNTVSNFMNGVYTNGAGIYAHNTVYNCTTNYFGGTAGAGNSP